MADWLFTQIGHPEVSQSDEEEPTEDEDEDVDVAAHFEANGNKQPFIYNFEEDAYANALIMLMMPSKDKSLICLRGFLALSMFLVWIVQLMATMALWKSVQAETNSNLLSTSLIVEWSQFGESSMPTNIDPGAAEAVCGKYVSSVDPQYTQGLSYYPLDEWTTQPQISKWSHEGPLLEQTIRRLYLLNPKEISFYAIMVGIVGWTCAFLAELKSIWLLLEATLIKLPTSRSLFAGDQTIDERHAPPMLYVSGLTLPLKFFAALLIIMRLSVAIFLYFVGCAFLRQHLNITDIVLNSVALVFVLELDTMVHQALNTLTSNIYSNESVAIKIDNDNPDSPDAARPGCDGLLMLLMVIIIGGLFAWNYHMVKSDLTRDFSVYASICLYAGPPPSLKLPFDFTFPVTGFCESLLCIRFDKLSLTCPPENVRPVSTLSPYLAEVQERCLGMMQEPYKTYDVSETLNGVKTKTTAKLGTRYSDQDLAQASLDDAAMNFWCPLSNVRGNLEIMASEAAGFKLALPPITSLPPACKSKLYTDYEKKLSGIGKGKYECCKFEVDPRGFQWCRSCPAPATTTTTTMKNR